MDGWLDKNKDPINMTVAALFKASKGNKLLSYLFQDIGVEEGFCKILFFTYKSIRMRNILTSENMWSNSFWT